MHWTTTQIEPGEGIQWHHEGNTDHYVTLQRAAPAREYEWYGVLHVGSLGADDARLSRSSDHYVTFGTQSAAFGWANGYMNRSADGHPEEVATERPETDRDADASGVPS